MKTLIDYVSFAPLVEGILQVREEMHDSEQLTTLANQLLDILFDEDDWEKFEKLVEANNDFLTETLGDYRDCYLAAVFDFGFSRTLELYAARAIPESVLAEIMSDFDIHARNFWNTHGKPGIDVYSWLALHVRARIFKFGRLQVEVSKFNPKAFGDAFSECDDCLAVHIPAIGPLNLGECKASMERGLAFAREHFPERDFKTFTLSSWLLAAEHHEVLSESANILKFGNLFEIIGSANCSHPSIYGWLFGFDKKKDDWKSHADLAKSSLQIGAHRLIEEERWFVDRNGIRVI